MKSRYIHWNQHLSLTRYKTFLFISIVHGLISVLMYSRQGKNKNWGRLFQRGRKKKNTVIRQSTYRYRNLGWRSPNRYNSVKTSARRMVHEHGSIRQVRSGHVKGPKSQTRNVLVRSLHPGEGNVSRTKTARSQTRNCCSRAPSHGYEPASGMKSIIKIFVRPWTEKKIPGNLNLPLGPLPWTATAATRLTCSGESLAFEASAGRIRRSSSEFAGLFERPTAHYLTSLENVQSNNPGDYSRTFSENTSFSTLESAWKLWATLFCDQLSEDQLNSR